MGKTTILEAVRILAERGSLSALSQLLDRREEFESLVDRDNEKTTVLDYRSLFFDHTAEPRRTIAIGTRSGEDRLRIELLPALDLSPEEQEQLWGDFSTEDVLQAIKIVYRGRVTLLAPAKQSNWSRRRLIHQQLRDRAKNPDVPTVACESLGPGLPSNRTVTRMWDRVALSDEEDLAIRALRLADPRVERVALVSDKDSRSFAGAGRRVLARLQGQRRPVPLKRLGDGAVRLFAAALALANSRGGFLLMDEAENGLHYSVQTRFWNMVLRAAYEYEVQVLATTHSRDCVKGFARAANGMSEVEGVYLRLEHHGESVRAVEYSEEEIETAAEQDIEVR